ncbi:MAG: nuclear transport factor 2 family protein [Bacteroidota bacterium]|jgi:hypothetical protein
MKKPLFIFLVAVALINPSCETKSVPDIQKEIITETKRQYSEEEQKVFNQLKIKDSLLFDAVFSSCDTALVKSLITPDLEFYHDKSGASNSDTSFIRSITGLCKSEFKPSRELEPGSLEIYLMKNNDVLYGAIQTGKHVFYETPPRKEKQLTSTARFTHLWLLENGNWKLKRVLSYFHQTPEAEK